jgi:LPS-assembly protein
MLATAVAIGLWLGGAGAEAQAQGIVLRSSPRLQESLSPEENRNGGIHVSGERITARPDMDLVLEGQAMIRRPGMVVRAGRIYYDQTEDALRAEGGVSVNRQGNLFQGPRLQLQADSFTGHFDAPSYTLTQGGHGDARQLEFIDQDRMALQDARYTTCRATPGPEWLPEWLLRAATLRTDAVEDTGVAEGVQLEFKGWRTPTLPDLSFSLSAQRKSGLLAPLFGVDTTNGIDIQQPYYWNIAPNRDLTITPRLMSLRGAAVESDFRYLENDYRGQARINWMPSDSLRQTQRWAVSGQHTGTLDAGAIGPLGLGLSLNRVSDDNYWRDFPRTGSGSNIALTQRLLPSNANLNWSQDQLSMQMRVLKWQTLQDITSGSFIKPPYDRDPQLTVRYGAWQPSGLDWSVTGDTTHFVADYSRLPTSYGNPSNGERSYVQAQVSQTWSRPWGFLTPKMQLHATRYQMQNPLSDGNSVVNRSLPTLSLDSGLMYERETQWFGRGLTQTLEPRLFYAYTPYRNQSALPNYDTGLTDFSLTTIYSENPYVGQDRIVDNNALTLGVNSRFFDSTTGAELLRLGIAQRIRFANQRVTLNPDMTGDRSGLSDLLLGAGTRWNDQVSLDTAVQINNDTHQVSRATVQARYNPGPYRLLNAAYRLNRGVAGITDPSELVDLGWQWPLSDLRWGERPDDSGVRSGGQGLGAERWYSVGRMNYSLQDRKPVDTLIGFEYDAGCWIGRIVLERLQSTVAMATTRLLFQLELVGFARVGASPLDSLRNNIPRYQFLRDTTTTPSRFLHYD